MTKRLRVLLAAVVAAGTAACGDADRSPPTSPSFKTTLTPLCGDLKNAVGQAFANPDQKTASGFVTQIYSAPQQQGAIAPVYNLLRLLTRDVDNGTALNGPSAAARVANDALDCLPTTITTGTGVSLPITDLTKAFDKAQFGLAAVRGGVGDPTSSILAPNGRAGLNLDQSLAGTWGAALGGAANGRAFIYGFPGTVSGTYQIFTVPKIGTLQVPRAIVVGLCTSLTNKLLKEAGATGDVLLNPASAGFLDAGGTCTPLLSSKSPRRGILEDAFKFATRVFGPTPARAAVLNPGGVGGGARGYSTFSIGDAGTITVTFDPDVINDANVNSNLTSPPGTNPITVRVFSGAVPVDADVNMSFSANSGAPSHTLSGTTTDTTGTDGIVQFTNLSIDQPGGARLIATITIPGIGTFADTSQSFNVRP